MKIVKREEIILLKKMLEEIKKIRGRGTELVSVYVPAGYDWAALIRHLEKEYDTAGNIQSDTTRRNVQTALEKIINALRSLKKIPPNGLVIFCGNVNPEGKPDFKIWLIEPPFPLTIRLYRCDNKFMTEPLEQLISSAEGNYGLVVLDSQEATFGLLKGRKIEVIKRYRSLVPPKSRAGGQCLDPKTKIMLESGEIICLKDIKEGDVIKGVDIEEMKVKTCKVIGIFEKECECYLIRTKSPSLEIIASKNHRFFVLDGDGIKERKAKELKEGDLLIAVEKIDVEGKHVVLDISVLERYRISEEGRRYLRERREKLGFSQAKLARKLRMYQATISAIELGKFNPRREILERICKVLNINFKEFVNKYCHPTRDARLPKVLDKNLARFLGYLLGDGSFEEWKIRICEGRKDVAEFYVNLAKKIFGTGSLKFRRDRNYYIVEVSGKDIVNFIIGNFPEILKKGIPKKIMISTNDVIAGFLAGLFDAEGYLTDSSVNITVSNRDLAEKILLLLLRLGIVASFYQKNTSRNPYSKKPQYVVSIRGKESLGLFYGKIGFASKEKMEKLKKILEKAIKNRNRRALAPWIILKKNVEKPITKILPRAALPFLRGEKRVTKGTLKKWFSRVKSLVEKYINGDLIITEIVEIKDLGKRKLIDIETTLKNFIANGLLVHNSSVRFQRVRQNLLRDWLNKIADEMKKIFLGIEDLKGIILGGPGPIKEVLYREYLDNETKRKIIGVVDTCYTDEYGLKELIERGKNLLKDEDVIREKELVRKFFDHIVKDDGLSVYGEEEVLRALEYGAVDVLLLSESLPSEKIKYFVEKAKEFGTEVFIVSKDTEEGAQFEKFGGIGGILRFRI